MLNHNTRFVGIHKRFRLITSRSSGRFRLGVRDSRPVVLIGGGIGVTPLISILNTIVVGGGRRKVWLFYGVQNRAHHAFYAPLRQLEGSHKNFNLVVCYSRPTKSCLKRRDFHHHGRITTELLRKKLPNQDCVYYVCGPAPMIQDIIDGLKDWGVPDEDINFEPFGASTAKTRVDSRAATDAATDRAAPVITFARSRTTARWTPEFDVFLDVAEMSGVKMNSGCRAGQCGSCMIQVLEGKVRHLVEPGIALAQDHCLACVAVPETELVLDA